jgi:hypothetical protein
MDEACIFISLGGGPEDRVHHDGPGSRPRRFDLERRGRLARLPRIARLRVHYAPFPSAGLPGWPSKALIRMEMCHTTRP